MSISDKKIKKDKALELYLKFPALLLGALTILCILIYIVLINSYVINVSPSDARPLKFELKSGVGVFLNNKLYTASSANQVDVLSPGYLTEAVQITPESPTNIDVVLKPKPASITISTEPAVAELKWYVNDEIVAVESELVYILEPGKHSIEAVSPYHQPSEIEITLSAAEQLTKVLELDKISGQFIVLSNPIGATVSVNQESMGTTPTVLPLDGGEYQIELALDGYQTLKDTIEVRIDDTEPNRNYRLTPLQSTVITNVSPKGGVLRVDGNLATSPQSVDANKRHTIRYEKAGFLPFETSVYLAPGESENINISLEPELANVKFTATLTSQVSINGKPVGQTPIELSLQTLETDVVFSRPGYRAVKKRFKVSPEKHNQVHAEMLTEYAARRREGRPLFISELGIDMVRVEAKPFTMGSAANVPHRKQHEYPVKVEFSRPFWFATKEITQAQFAKYKSGTASSSMPITNVSWEDAIQFCNWLSEQEGLPPFYDIARGTVNEDSPGYRLPTEAEWEYMASSYMQYTKFQYFWGNKERLKSNQGNYADDALSGSQTFVLKGYQDNFKGAAPVGSFKPRNGLYDMDGNVSEWVNDIYNVIKPNLSRVYTDYQGADSGTGHVVKGGSYKSGRLRELRNAVRLQGTAGKEDIGFRIARYVE